jgi:hypothetical protein
MKKLVRVNNTKIIPIYKFQYGKNKRFIDILNKNKYFLYTLVLTTNSFLLKEYYKAYKKKNRINVIKH